MRATLTLIRHELRQRWLLAVAAAIAGLLPLAAPILPTVREGGADDVRPGLAAFLAAILAAGTAVAYGANMVATDLRERRLSFYLARPVSIGAIWAAKLSTGVLLALGAAGLAVLPAALLSPGSFSTLLDPVPLGAIAVGCLLLLGISHLVAVAAASRSPLIALDLAALALLGFLASHLIRRLQATRAEEVIGMTMTALALAAIALVLAAGWAQLAAGRSDPVRGHRVQSAVLWGSATSVVIVLAVWVAFLVTPSPASLRNVDGVLAADTGTWAMVRGAARGRGDYRPTFLVDTATGRFLRLPDGIEPPRLSRDGNRAVWLSPTGTRALTTLRNLVTVDLTDTALQPCTTSIIVDSQTGKHAALSPDGSRVALFQEMLVAVHQLPDGRMLATARLDVHPTTLRMVFVDNGRLRIEAWVHEDSPPNPNRGELIIAVLDIGVGRLEVTGRLDLVAAGNRFRVLGPGGDRMVLRHPDGDLRRLVLHDGWTGEPLASLGAWPDLAHRWVSFLSDGRIAVDGSHDGEGSLLLFDESGALVAAHPVGPAGSIRVRAEPVPDRLLLEIVTLPPVGQCAASRQVTAALLDLDSGALLPIASSRLPAYRWTDEFWWLTPLPPPGRFAGRLLVTDRHGLELLDPNTGATAPIPGLP